MFSIANHPVHSCLQYVIAINCCAGPAISRIIHRLRMMNISCMDVIAYDSVRDFKFYFDHVEACERLPLLFIFSEDDLCLAHEYQDMEVATVRLAA